MKPTNLLYILSDQHQAAAMGCAGHPLVQTPNLDALAAGGTRFTKAYTNCAICVPARAALATGRYVHEIGNWDNGLPYDGSVPSWGRRLKAAGHTVASIGKLHFRSAADDNGFTEEIEPLHVVDGVGDPASGIRDGSIRRDWRPGIEEAGPADSTYQQYDIRNGENAVRWLRRHAADDGQPWVLFLSFVTPHPPFLAPPQTYGLYSHDDIELPPQWRASDMPQHPAYQYMRRFFSCEQPLDEAVIRRLHAAYYGICTFLDAQIGRVLAELEALNLRDSTRVIYTSDHGEHLGARGIYGKFTMYEEASAIPFIMSGPDVPAGKEVDTPVSLIDSYPTILEGVGCPADDNAERPGNSLWQIAASENQARTVFAEYHAIGSRNAFYMLRDRRYKFIYHIDAPPQLFDLTRDPNEIKDLAQQPDTESQTLLADYEAQLRRIIDPEAVDRQAKADQQQRIEALGGRDAVVARGAFVNSPTPGEAPRFRQFEAGRGP